MLRAPRPGSGPLRPVTAAGLVLLALAAALLVLGRIVFAANPVAFEDAVVAVGLAVLAGAALATVLGAPAASPPPARPFGGAAGTGPVVAAPDQAPPASTLPPIAPAAAPSSIPASYVAALYASAPGVEPLADEPGPIAAALPFAALPRPSGPHEGGPVETAPSLDVELARLRARVQELEADRNLDATPPWFAARSGGSRDLSPLALSAPHALRPLTGGPGRCVGCGSSVAAQAADPLCGNCGRPLCEGCGGPAGPTVGLRRCPACRAGSAKGPGVAISGGRRAVDPGSAGPDGPVGPS